MVRLIFHCGSVDIIYHAAVSRWAIVLLAQVPIWSILKITTPWSHRGHIVLHRGRIVVASWSHRGHIFSMVTTVTSLPLGRCGTTAVFRTLQDIPAVVISYTRACTSIRAMHGSCSCNTCLAPLRGFMGSCSGANGACRSQKALAPQPESLETPIQRIHEQHLLHPQRPASAVWPVLLHVATTPIATDATRRCSTVWFMGPALRSKVPSSL